jgi:hypothetical protein
MPIYGFYRDKGMILSSDSVLRATARNIRARDRSRAWDRHDFRADWYRLALGARGKSVEPCFWEYTVPFYASVVSPSPHWCYDPRHGYAAISGRRPDRRGSGGGDDVADGRTDTG